jgi:hypothetical protein
MLGSFSLLVLLAQTPTLATDPLQASMTCAHVSVLAPLQAGSPLRTTSHFTYFVMEAAIAKPDGKPFLERLSSMIQEVTAATAPSEAEAKTLAPQCDRRFPVGRKAGAPALPADLQGATEEIKKEPLPGASGGDPATLESRIAALLGPIQTRLTDEALQKNGFKDEASFTAAMGEQIAASTALGDPASVAQSCGLSAI